MNRRPGHAPQPLPAVDALAGAAALAEMAIAISAVRPSAILTNLILRNSVIFTGCPFLWRGHQPGRRPKAPAVSNTLLASQRPEVLPPPGAHTGARRRISRRHETGRARREPIRINRTAGKRRRGL